MIDELLVILCAPCGVISLFRFTGGTLRTGIQCDHAIISEEVIDLLLPYFCRHGPARDEQDDLTGAPHEVVKFDAIAGGEEGVLQWPLSFSTNGIDCLDQRPDVTVAICK